MSLLGVRKNVIKFSGRYDLVTAADCVTDNGADLFIRAASRVLDMDGDHDRALKYWTGNVGANACRITLQDCRMVFKVWWENSDGAWIELDPLGYNELIKKDYYPMLDKTTPGTPLYWAREPIHRDARNQGLLPLMSAMGIIVMPPTDTDIAVRVYGKFYEKTLVDNTDVNYWSEEHPLLLTYAALREMETTYRNKQGSEDWGDRIDKYLFSIDKDLVEAQDKDSMEMEG